jgi:zinc and cadmium transporter
VNGLGALLPYALGVVAAAVAGGSIPLWSRGHPRLLELFFAGSAGVVLGVLGGHLLPQAFKAGPVAAWAIIAGFLFMLVVERFVLPHALHSPHHGEVHAECSPEVEAAHVRADAAGIGAFVGLSLHTLADGLALGAACQDVGVAPYVFVAIVAHKVPSAFALGSILVRAQVRRSRVLLGVAALGSMVGLGGLLYLVAQRFGQFQPAAVTPFAVAFSAGSFLHVALTDLLPDLHPSGARRREMLAALVGGLVLTVAVSLLTRD